MIEHKFTKVPACDLVSTYHAESMPTLWGRPLSAKIIHANLLTESQVEVEMETPGFQLDKTVENLETPFIQYLKDQYPDKYLSNDQTVRLKSIYEIDGKLHLTVQPATYFQYLLTGWAPSQNYGVRGSDGVTTPIRELVEPGPYLSPLSIAKASNHIGVVALLICEDHLLMNVRSNRQITDSNRLGLSASGVLKHDGNVTSLFYHAFVELQEEIGLRKEDIDFSGTKLAGIAREFERAGKPEAYVIFRSKRSLKQTSEAIQERRGIDAWETIKNFWVKIEPETLRRLQNQYQFQPSTRIGLWFLLKHLGAGLPLL